MRKERRGEGCPDEEGKEQTTTEKIGRSIGVWIPNKWPNKQGAIIGPFRIIVDEAHYPTYCSNSCSPYPISGEISDSIIS